MKTQYCVICDSDNPLGAFSTEVRNKRVTVCAKCSREIRGIVSENVRDTIYDSFVNDLLGTRQIVINSLEDGRFALSFDAQVAYVTTMNIPFVARDREDRHSTATKGQVVCVNGNPHWYHGVARDDNVLVDTVKRLGAEACGWNSQLKIVTIPSDVDWEVVSFCGREWVAEKHRTWY